VPVSTARRVVQSRFPLQAGYSCGLAAVLLLFCGTSLQNAAANGDTRTISFHHIHTGEDLTITYKVNGRYDEEALKKINYELRDWRKNETIKMDPHLIDLVWDVQREVEATGPIWVVCGYRSPGTNAMLRRRSRGVAQHSQHMLGKAMDFYIPGVPLAKLREAGLRAQRGGVGYYPTSGSPFVHLDTGSVRHWPHMPEAALAKVLAKGPLTQVAANDTVVNAPAGSGVVASFTNLLSRMRGDSAAVETVAAPAPEPKPARPVVAAAVPLPQARPGSTIAKRTPPAPAFALASAESKPALLRPSADSSLFSEHGLWETMPQTEPAPAAAEPVAAPASSTPPRPPNPISVAAVEPETTASLTPWPSEDRKQVVASAGGLAYAPAIDEAPRTHPAPMGKLMSRPPAVQPDTTVAVKRAPNRPTSVISSAPPSSQRIFKSAERLNDPWMRAMVVSPSAMSFMNTSFMGAPDYRALGPYLHKPTSSVMMTFSEDPYLGMTVGRFTGSAVVFVSTITYTMQTAALQ
jgi:uncharacterized protein YcbK (DUF882 family)